MIFKAPDHKNNSLKVQVNGNFTDSKDSFYKIWNDIFVHITFVKRSDGVIMEEVRDLIVLSEIDQFFPAEEPELIYSSNFRSVRGYREFLKRQQKFHEHEELLKKYASLIRTQPDWGIRGDTPF